MSGLLNGRHNIQYKSIFAVHNEYQKRGTPFSDPSSHAGSRQHSGGGELFNGVDNLEDGRIIGIAKPLRNSLFQYWPDPIQTIRRQCVT